MYNGQTTRKWKNVGRFGLVLMFVVLVSTPIAHAKHVTSQESSSDLQGVRVAIYDGAGVLHSSKVALERMFQWMNATTGLVDGTQIRNGTLDDYDILAMPGGSALTYQAALQTEGLEIVRNFVRTGGSYFGICGGSLFATNIYLSLFNGSYSNSINGSGIHLTQVNVNRSSSGPDLSDEPESYLTMYWASSFFYSSDMSGIIPITTYPQNDRPGMIAFMYGQGTAFLSSAHPEYEEGNDRDGLSEFDYLEDPDSEWGLILKVSCWLIDASTVESSGSADDFLLPILYSSVAVGGLVIILTYLRKRK
ncbi:MAG: BPL-N domain-containing protein [Candidatus Thorarchaeota archaeon]|jgi:glutamine amidotransferase-like uncharacterized protein